MRVWNNISVKFIDFRPFAIRIIELLNLYYELGLSTDQLVIEAEKIKNQLKEINEKTREQHSEINPKIPQLPDSHKNLYL